MYFLINVQLKHYWYQKSLKRTLHLYKNVNLNKAVYQKSNNQRIFGKDKHI